MPTITIELPKAEYRVALALPETERRRLVVDAFAKARDVAIRSDGETTAQDIVGIGESLADEAAGRVTEGGAARQQIRERLGWASR